MGVSTYAETNFSFLASRLLMKWSVSVIGWSIQESGDLEDMTAEKHVFSQSFSRAVYEYENWSLPKIKKKH